MSSQEANLLKNQEKNKAISDFDNLYSRISGKGKEILKYFFSKKEIFHDNLKIKYPNRLEYMLYHKLIGSTPPDSCQKIDFLGDDSVLKFMHDFEKEISEK